MLRGTLVGKLSNKQINARILLDSGAEGLMINEPFARKHSLTLRRLRHPFPAINVDGSKNSHGLIQYTTIQRLRLSDSDENYHQEDAEFYVTNVGDVDIIIGTDWLKRHNPVIDWATDSLRFSRCPTPCSLSTPAVTIHALSRKPSMRIYRLTTPEDEPPNEEPPFENLGAAIFPSTEHSLPLFPDEEIHAIFCQAAAHIRAKSTTSTEIAARTAPDSKQPLENLVPPEYLKYRKIFSETASHRLPKHQPWDHAIELKPGAELKDCGLYRMPPDEREGLKNTIKDLLSRGLIRESKAPQASPVFFVEKKDGTKRFVQDYRNLNAITIKNAYPLPLIPDLIDKLQGARYFTKFDVRWGYNNIRIRAGDEWKAAFKTPFGLYEPLVMFFGLCNSPATFQSFMNMAFKDLIDSNHVVVYMDDILIFTDTLEELRILTHQVLQKIDEYDLFLKPEKCFFAQTTIEYLGLVISAGRVSMDPAKVTGITNWPNPRTLKQLQAFLGFCNFYRRFILDYSRLARPLFNLTRKDVPFTWTPEADAAFTLLKTTFTTAPVLALPDHTRPFRLIVDASDFAIGAILEQPDELNRWHPLTYLSKSLDATQRNWVIHDKELWSIIWPLIELRHYFEGATHPVEIWTDHNNLTYFMTKQKLTRRQARWALTLSRYDIRILHKPGAYNKADALSRRPDHKEGIEHDNGDRVLLDNKILAIKAVRPGNSTQIPIDIRKAIKESQDHDPEVSTALTTILANGPKSISKGLEDWNLEDGLILRKGRIYVPRSPELRRELTRLYHESPATGHPGRWKTYEILTREYWWPGMSTFVKDFVDGCATCQTTKTLPKTTVPLQPNDIPANIWQTITMDFITDLPQSKGYDSLLVTVDRFSKAVILAPCNKTITALETTELILNNVWRRVGLPRQIISDRGPQFAAKVTQELWKKLNVRPSLSTAFHPQTDGETERVNQEIEQYLRIFCNYQQDNWAELLPFAEFAHNIRTHSATKRSPFEIWYGYQPEFIPPLQFATTIPALEERLRAMEQLRQEVAASLKVAAEIMKSSRPDAPTHRFKEGDMVFLEGTNIQTTHPKAKLSPKRHGPFKVTAAWTVTSRLDLPKNWKIHPVFHNSLLRPYKETAAHGPNYPRPPPEVVQGETDHYEIEDIVKTRLTPNKRGVQYLVKWKGYPDSENSWIAASGMKHATNLTQTFHKKYPRMPKPAVLQA